MTFLPNFFETLNTKNIRYCVLRNYHQLPYSTDGSDLDILIDKNDSFLFLSILNETCQSYQGMIVSFIPSEICPRICLLGSENGGWGLMIDLHYNQIQYRGHTIVTNQNIWKNTFIYRDNINVLNPRVDALIGLFKELLNNKTCKQKYYDDFKKYCLNAEFLDEIFGVINKQNISQILMEYLEVEYSEKRIKKLAKQLIKEFPIKKNTFFYYFVKLKRIIKKPGYTIVFLGTDGSGKSTIIETLKPVLNKAFHKAVYYEHLRPNKFPSIARLLGKKEEFNVPVTEPHSKKPSGFLGSLFRWGYYLIDYTLGYALKIYPKKAIRSCVWIFDRYYYDYIIDPKRVRIKLPKVILKIGQIIIPEPDIILCLGTNAEIIHERKPELDLGEVHRQVTDLKFFCNSHKHAVWIDTGTSIEVSSDNALKAIRDIMGKRFESIKL